ncbi:hypothetical protein GCM10009557_91520 [Virgisporangium ochraceum]|uniref:Uncharacterized protein n=1 Tax=Virgisporangium ochraceum TaxID=65505 RepID=A0A8J4A1J2_9ACTN|nr:hypothetical protein [Virgisporangium ochraceum]GIJ71570.1 hypothetical protein Voc01_064870 [Virgisporangium ochraceum]
MDDHRRRLAEHQERLNRYDEQRKQQQRAAEQNERMRRYYDNGGQGLRGWAAVVAVLLWLVAMVVLFW